MIYVGGKFLGIRSMRWTRWVTILSKDIFGWSILKFKVYHLHTITWTTIILLSCWKFTKRICDKLVRMWQNMWHCWRTTWRSPRDVITSLLSQNKYGTVDEYQKPVKIVCSDRKGCQIRLYNFEILPQNRKISVDVGDEWWRQLVLVTNLKCWWQFFHWKSHWFYDQHFKTIAHIKSPI